MTYTSEVKKELAQMETTKTNVRKAEVSSILRFAGGLHLIAGRIVVEAEVDDEIVARRLGQSIQELYGLPSEVVKVSGGVSRNKTSSRYIVRVLDEGEALARQTGLLDGGGRPVRGLPSSLVNGSKEETIAMWRGAFLAKGTLSEPGRAASLEIACPTSEASLALVGAARRLDILAKAREVRGGDRTVIRDGESILHLLDLMGIEDQSNTWDDPNVSKEVRASANRLANFDDANLRRSAQAAVAAGVRVERALEILGDDVPDHLLYAGQLRLQHKQASLDELGRLAEPQMTKDAIAGRIRRLLSMADKKAKDLNLPLTENDEDMVFDEAFEKFDVFKDDPAL